MEKYDYKENMCDKMWKILLSLGSIIQPIANGISDNNWWVWCQINSKSKSETPYCLQFVSTSLGNNIPIFTRAVSRHCFLVFGQLTDDFNDLSSCLTSNPSLSIFGTFSLHSSNIWSGSQYIESVIIWLQLVTRYQKPRYCGWNCGTLCKNWSIHNV